jgi:hypothetical protein
LAAIRPGEETVESPRPASPEWELRQFSGPIHDTSGTDAFYALPPEEQESLRHALKDRVEPGVKGDFFAGTTRDPLFPLTDPNAEAALVGGPAGTTPHVGSGPAEPDVVFRNGSGDAVWAREVVPLHSSDHNGFADTMNKAHRAFADTPGEVWLQVPSQLPSESINGLMTVFTADPETRARFMDTYIIFRDEDGNVRARYGPKPVGPFRLPGGL